MINLTAAEDLFLTRMNLTSLDDLSIPFAKELFLKYRENGVIKDGCSFDDNKWQTTDEYSNVGLDFNISVFTYKNYEDVFNMPLKDFTVYLKAFCLSIFGKNVLTSISYTILDVKHFLKADVEDVCEEVADLRFYSPNRLHDFLSLFITDENSERLDRLISSIDGYAAIKYDGKTGLNQRELSDFHSYFEFDDIIKRYWDEPLTKEERLFYYPLYIWWHLTAVIPLRPREFLLTERNCLIKDGDGKYSLKLRRNQLKGTRDREISYKISDSYITQILPIPENTARMLETYIKDTEIYDSTEIDTLFVTDPHYYKWGQSKHSNSRFLTYINLNTILKYFFNEIIENKYGYTVRYDGMKADFQTKEISYIHLGDARHIAFINLMQEGATPVTAMLLGGHDNIEMASHYYSNVTEFIECKTYRQYHKSLSGEIQYNIMPMRKIPNVRDYKSLNKDGRCYSLEYAKGSISDCLNVSGPDGEIGHCPSCPFFRSDSLSYYSKDDIYKNQIFEDSKSLFHALQAVMEGKGNPENIGEAVLRARSSSLSYSQYLMEKYQQEGK